MQVDLRMTTHEGCQAVAQAVVDQRAVVLVAAAAAAAAVELVCVELQLLLA
jgi:hypothetical protein